jgi:RimJ/RimL family protein N-acetyltransferase
MTDNLTLRTDMDGLLLKQYLVEDASAIFNLIDQSRDHLSQYGEETASKYPTLESVVESVVHPSNPDKSRLGIWHENNLVGGINLRPDAEATAEIGYWLGEIHTGKGYMHHAVAALTDYAFANGFEEVYASVHRDNNASARVLLKAGYAENTAKLGFRIFSKKASGLRSEANV